MVTWDCMVVTFVKYVISLFLQIFLVAIYYLNSVYFDPQVSITTARCYAQAWYMPACSVRLSVTFVDHVKMNKHIFDFFSPSGSHTILVFPYQTGWRYSDGNPPDKGIEW